jgi:ATP-binding cassette subfamily G (WHITE) protein 1/ATP-binding cassette subfamily G (WHITE) protein 2
VLGGWVEVTHNIAISWCLLFVRSVLNKIEVLVSQLSTLRTAPVALQVFSGLFVNNGSIQPYFIWISYISPMRYSFIAFVKNEFSGLKITCKYEHVKNVLP